MHILYVGHEIKKIQSGADQVNRRNADVLKHIATVDFISLSHNSLLQKVGFYLAGLNESIEKQILDRIATGSYDYVFLSISQLGRLSKTIKRKFPQQKVICFYHNSEVHYAREFLRVSGIHHILFYLSVRYNETLAARWSDYHITLNERDASLLEQIYGKKANLVCPTSFKDTFDESKVIVLAKEGDISYLFVGVSFFANVEGIRWFINNVLPHVPGRLDIVGKGMEKYSKEFDSDRVSVHGFVPDLSQLYYAADFVVLPIFCGGGMKTKTAEALMYGKTIIGAPEAFEGYRLDEAATYVCKTAPEFIATINLLINKGRVAPFNDRSRRLFKENYDENRTIVEFRKFLEKV